MFIYMQCGHYIFGPMYFSNASHSCSPSRVHLCCPSLCSPHPPLSTCLCAHSLCCKQWPLCFIRGMGKHVPTWETACFMPWVLECPPESGKILRLQRSSPSGLYSPLLSRATIFQLTPRLWRSLCSSSALVYFHSTFPTPNTLHSYLIVICLLQESLCFLHGGLLKVWLPEVSPLFDVFVEWLSGVGGRRAGVWLNHLVSWHFHQHPLSQTSHTKCGFTVAGVNGSPHPHVPIIFPGWAVHGII